MQQAEAGRVEDVESDRLRGAQFLGGPQRQAGTQATIHVAPPRNFHRWEAEGDGAAGGQVLPRDLAIAHDVTAQCGEFHCGERERHARLETLEQLARFGVQGLALQEAGGMQSEAHDAARRRIEPQARQVLGSASAGDGPPVPPTGRGADDQVGTEALAQYAPRSDFPSGPKSSGGEHECGHTPGWHGFGVRGAWS